MTSTMSEPTVRHAAPGGRRRLRQAELAGRHGANPAEPLPASKDKDKPSGDRGDKPSDKLSVPRPSVPLLQRPRVTELLHRASAHRVTMVCGPSGAGKTVACALWAATTPVADSVAWISLDRGDRSPDQLWAQVCSALTSIPVVPGDLAGALPAPRDKTFPIRLAEATQRLGTQVTLILDDVTHLAGAAALPGLDHLVRHGPRNLRLVLSGRHPAGLPIARLRVGGELAEISGSDLACTPEEADGYFTMLGLRLPAAQRDDLLWHTRGWMAGLRLAAMRAAQGRPGTPVSRIAGDDPEVADYLWDEVLADLSADRRQFLLRTCVVDVLSGDLADTLTAGSGGTGILAEMCRENLMVEPATARPGTPPQAGPPKADPALTSAGRAEFRYHPLLLELLRAKLRRELPGEVTGLTRKAARWHAGHGMRADAIRDAARAGDWDFAARVLAEAGPAMLLPGPSQDLEPVLTTFPAARYTSDAAVAGALAAAGLRTGDSCAAELHLHNARQSLHRSPAPQRRIITPWLQALLLMSAGLPCADGPAAATQHRELVEQSRAVAIRAESGTCGPAERAGLGLLWCELGVVALASMDVADARVSFGKARQHLRDNGYPEFEHRARAWQALAEGFYGDLSAASELLADRDHGHGAVVDPLSSRLAELATAHVHWARDELAGARKSLDASEPDDAAARQASHGRHARQATESAAGRLVSSLVAMTRARIALCEGDQRAARTLLTRLRYELLKGPQQGQLRSGAQDSVIDLALAPFDADIALRDGDVSRARLALEREPAPDPARADLLLATARVQLAQGDSAGALRSAAACLDGTASQITLHDHVCALVTTAIAYRRLGQAEQASEQLAWAVAVAEPQDMFRPFLDGGSAARSVLTSLVRPASQCAAFATRILQRFDAIPAWQSGQQAAPTPPLTSSELAVLRLLPAHMTNQEIAEALFLSINTVKTHLRSVYRKLGVTTRRQAIARSGRLGLL